MPSLLGFCLRVWALFAGLYSFCIEHERFFSSQQFSLRIFMLLSNIFTAGHFL